MQTPLSLVKNYLITTIIPQAEEIDRDSKALIHALAGLGKLQLLGLRIPPTWGGMSVDPHQFSVFQELIVRYSGALAFLKPNINSRMFIAQGENESLKQAYLPSMVGGELLIGVGFSHLRRRVNHRWQLPPSMVVIVCEGMSVGDWMGIFSEFIIGATLPDGETILGLVPLANINRAILCSQP